MLHARAVFDNVLQQNLAQALGKKRRLYKLKVNKEVSMNSIKMKARRMRQRRKRIKRARRN